MQKFIKIDTQFRITIPAEMREAIQGFEILSIKQENDKLIITTPINHIKEAVNNGR